METFDVAIIGGGAAGLSAALVLSRARRSVVVIDGGQPRNAPASHMHGFLSRDGLPPGELLRIGREEARGYGAVIVEGDAHSVDRVGGGFMVTTADLRTLEARRLVVATGLWDVVVDIPGVAERWGVDVLHCPYCHGFEVADRPLGVLGGNPLAAQHALLVRQWSSDVVYFPHTSALNPEEAEQLAARGVGVIAGPVTRVVVEDDRLQGVELADGTVVPRSAVFVRPDLVPRGDSYRRLGVATDPQGWPIVDASGQTSAAGVWAVGNAANPRAQVITAAGEGSAAAIAINNDLVTEDVQNAVCAFRAGKPA